MKLTADVHLVVHFEAPNGQEGLEILEKVFSPQPWSDCTMPGFPGGFEYEIVRRVIEVDARRGNTKKRATRR
jgi:hypothetical protein